MVKRLGLIVLCVLMMVTTGCKNDEDLTEPKYVLIEKTFEDIRSNVVYVDTHKYDKDGNIIWFEQIINGVPSSATESIYEKGRLVGEVYYTNGAEDGRSEVVSYTNDGLPTHVHGDIFRENSDMYYEYNECGDILAYWISDSDGDEFLRQTFKYDDAGNLLEEKFIQSSMKRITTYDYNEIGNLLRKTTTTYDDYYGEYSGFIEFEYDENNNVSLEIIASDDQEGIEYNKPSYDELGRMTSECHYDENWNQLYHTEFTYDENGNLEKEITTGSNGEIMWLTTYVYELIG